MKICFITYNIFSVGGVQRVVSVLANQLVEDYDIEILCINDKYNIDRSLYNLDDRIYVNINSRLIENNLFYKISGKIGRLLNEKTNLFEKICSDKILENVYINQHIRNKFIDYINENKYDIVIGVEGYSSLLLSMISEKICAKTIGWQHNSYDAYFNTKDKYYWKQDILFKKNISKLDKYVVLTDYDKKMLQQKMNINSIRIYNPLSFESKKKSQCNNKEIIFVGRLDQEQKGIDLLIRAFKLIVEEKIDWNLRIVGDGPDKQKLIKLIRELRIEDRVEINPFTEEIKKYYNNASIFVSSSRWEGFGLVITEAMECGLPVIAFANSGPKEIINKDGVNGILVPQNNYNLLARAIKDLIKNEQKRYKIAKNSKIRAKDFNVNKISSEWKNIINELNRAQ